MRAYRNASSVSSPGSLRRRATSRAPLDTFAVFQCVLVGLSNLPEIRAAGAPVDDEPLLTVHRDRPSFAFRVRVAVGTTRCDRRHVATIHHECGNPWTIPQPER